MTKKNRELSNLFVKDYYTQYPNSEIVEFDINGYTYLYAVNIETENKKVQNDDKIVAVYGLILNTDKTWIPACLDYGIFTKEFGLLINRFDNKKQ